MPSRFTPSIRPMSHRQMFCYRCLDGRQLGKNQVVMAWARFGYRGKWIVLTESLAGGNEVIVVGYFNKSFDE